MRNPLIDEIRRTRAKLSKELAEDPEKVYAYWRELRIKTCDVVISPTGEERYIASAKKMHDVLIAPRHAKKAARS
jgi:glutamyl-tRNA reductase